jgi:UDP-glucose 4-epimerase
MKALVTGGAGFIGSHLADELLRQGNEVTIVDDLAAGSLDNVPKKAKFVKKDIARDDLAPDMRGMDAVFHFAADPDVRSSATGSEASFNNNVVATFRVLEACRKAGVKQFVFASTSTVYGEASVIPTPEICHCIPISNYGASKLACEAYASSYAHSYGIKSTVLRYANIFGPRSTHGVMFDFYQKLKSDPQHLEILGNGKQEKSYLYVSDCVSATITASARQPGAYGVYNVGSKEKHTTDEIAQLVSRAFGTKPNIFYTGGERGWTGDVRLMLLDCSKIEKTGWSAKVGFEQGVGLYMDWLRSR